MKTRKNIAPFLYLLTWAALLCISGYLQAEQIRASNKSLKLNTPAAKLSAEEHSEATAWSEPAASYSVTSAVDPTLPLLLLVYGLMLHLLAHKTLKPLKAALGFSTLAERFRILPNAP